MWVEKFIVELILVRVDLLVEEISFIYNRVIIN